jgi:two-component system sporulation sensor kinase A
MSRKNLSKAILIILLLSPSAFAMPAQFVPDLSDIQSLALKLMVIIAIFLREKNRMNREAKLRLAHDKMMAQSFLAKKVAHDIRSPLSALQLIVNTLHADNKEQKQIIVDVVTRINGIAEDLLMSEKSQPLVAEKNEVEECGVNLKDMLSSLLKEKSSLFPQMKFLFDFQLENKWKGKGVELSRIISNVLNNAIESNSEGNMVHINAYETQEAMYIEVVDFGSGISEEVLAKLGQEQVSTKGSRGNGIGLFSAFQDLKAWGGEIGVQSKMGIGTKVTVKLPRK